MIKDTLQQLEERQRQSVLKAARVAIERVVAIKEGETVLINTNPEAHVHPIAESLFYQALEAGAEVSLIMRPRRWGKTINMSMLYYFA